MRKMQFVVSLAALLLLLSPAAMQAQKKQAQKKQPAAKVVEEVSSQEDVNFDNLLPSTAKVMFIDSFVVDRAKMMSRISLSRSAGSVTQEKVDGKIVYAYTNSLKNNRYLSKADAKGQYKLYHQTKKGTGWNEPEPVNIPGGFTDIVCPYLMSDGVTLYFAAKGGEDNLGAYDIYFTVYDADDGKFITPQSIGLPFNSAADDLYYIIDEESNIGHLVTSRRQNANKVCVYTFLPTESREMYDLQDDEDDVLLKSFAHLNSIKATQANGGKALADAKTRLSKVRSTASVKVISTAFPISKGITYYKSSDFRVDANRAKFDNYCSLKQQLSDKEIRLSALRKGYRNGQSYTKNEIIQLEKEVESERLALGKLATEIRNAELNKI